MSAVEVFTTFVDLVGVDAKLHADNAATFTKLLAFAEDISNVNVAARVKILTFVAQSIKFYDAQMCKKVAQLAVKVISQDGSEDPAVIAALKLLPALGAVASECKPEYFARECSDVVVQVILDDAGYSASVRQAARDVFQSMIVANFKPVLTKLIHLISDDRELDEVEQVRKERAFAWDTLSLLTKNKKDFGMQWTEEVQQHFLQCLAVVLHTVPRDEFVKLIEVASGLNVLKEKQMIPLLESYLGGAKLDELRSLEGLALIAEAVPRGTTETSLAEKLVKEHWLTSKSDALRGASSALQLAVLKVLVFASRTAPAEAAPLLLNEVLIAITATGVFSDAIPESLTAVEGLVLSLCNLGAKCGAIMLAALSDATLAAKLAKATTDLEQLQKQVLFAVKKKIDAETATQSDAQALSILENVITLIGTLAKRQLPSLASFTPSWAKVAKLPTMKRKSTDAPLEQPLKKAQTENPRRGGAAPQQSNNNNRQQQRNGNNNNNRGGNRNQRR